jgi:hypothetical protein
LELNKKSTTFADENEDCVIEKYSNGRDALGSM